MAYRKHVEIPLSEDTRVELRERYMDFGKPTEHMRWVVGTIGVADCSPFVELEKKHEGTLASALFVAARYVSEYAKGTEAAHGEKQYHVFTRPLYPSIPGGC